jgi:hypothetical protein
VSSITIEIKNQTYKVMTFNDLTAPRFNPRKYRTIFVHTELYNRWKEKVGRRDCTYGEFRRIWELIAKEIISTVQSERDGVRLDAGLGDLYVGYTQPRESSRKPVDYKLSQELGKTIYHENWHSSGKMVNIIYGTSNRKYIYKKRKMWGFEPTRDFSRQVSKSTATFPDRYKNSQERVVSGSKRKITTDEDGDY